MITNSVVYLYPDKDSADTGAEIGASGFLLSEPSTYYGNVRPSIREDQSILPQMRERFFAEFKKAQQETMRSDPGAVTALVTSNDVSREYLTHCHHIYVVTNKHVIEGKRPCPVVRMNLKHPGSGFERAHILDFKQSDWTTDPDNDLAVCMLPPDFNPSIVEFSVVSRNFAMTEKEFKEQNFGPGDTVVYVGRFVGHAGKYENMPSVRFGNISMNPNEREPVVYDTDDSTRMSQVGFLVEARSRSGYSGSPVFTLHQHVVNNPRAVIPWMDMRLLGVDWGHLPEKILLQDPVGYLHGSRWYVEVHAGMMGVVPAWRLLDFIDKAPRLIEQRQRDDELYSEIAGTVAKGVPDVDGERV